MNGYLLYLVVLRGFVGTQHLVFIFLSRLLYVDMEEKYKGKIIQTFSHVIAFG